MASEQLRRDTKENEREKPKVISHFESFTVKDSEKQPGTTEVVHRVVETIQGGASGGVHGAQSMQKKESEQKGPSLSKYRGVAQKNSMEAIRAAEQQSQMAKEYTGEKGQRMDEKGRVKESIYSATPNVTEQRASGATHIVGARGAQQISEHMMKNQPGATQTTTQKGT